MIPAEVWENWTLILSEAIELMLSNPICAFGLYGFVIVIITNLIYRLATPKKES